ncbi:MAG TPA: polyphosphate kinase 2 family protein [Thermoanaerobaculia bacterium]|jgi:PPK2 family polyphosphate:nucleotide phosphotransferase
MKFRLDDFDPGDTSAAPGDKDQTHKKLEKAEERLGELQELLFADHSRALLIVLQGMDTSGKDGTVRHVMHGVSPLGVRAVPFKKPTAAELDHDFLWRAHAQTPGKGEIVIFNRSHYEDVLIVRVHGWIDEDECKRRYDRINDFERLLVDNGTIVLKFFLNISKDEQRKRLRNRVEDPTKRWKFQFGDLDERKLWSEYQDAYEAAIEKTSAKHAPWIVVPADHKWVRNYVVAKTIVEKLESLDLKYPDPDLKAAVID